MDRKQRVIVKEHVSGWREVKSGVPLSSVRTLLFQNYINALSEGGEVVYSISTIADDAKLFFKRG